MSKTDDKLTGLRIAIAQINVKVGDIAGNLSKITQYYNEAVAQHADLVVVPELAVTGYPPEDLLYEAAWLEHQDKAIAVLAQLTAGHKAGLLVGLPIRDTHKTHDARPLLYNAAMLFAEGEVLGHTYKSHLPNYAVFDECRYFAPYPLSAVEPLAFRDMYLGVMICEDMWYEDVAAKLGKSGADLFIVLNASPYEERKRAQRWKLAQDTVQRHNLPLVYANLVGGQDELLFDGVSFIVDKHGALQIVAPAWEESLVIAQVGETSIVPKQNTTMPEQDIGDIYNGLVLGIRDYVHKNHFEKVLLGVSGGIDSALVAILAVDALGSNNVRGVFMPSVFTSQESADDTAALCQQVQCISHTVSIEGLQALVLGKLESLFANYPIDATEENIQARLRGLLLMALSNKYGELLLATGNKSEYAVGYTTLYGDMCGAFAPLKDVYKTKVYELVQWRNQNIPSQACVPQLRQPVPANIIRKAPTAELRANQKDEDTLPPYHILDQILLQLIEGYGNVEKLDMSEITPGIISHVYKMMCGAEFKRRQAPTGPKITTRSFGRDWRYPIAGRHLVMSPEL